VASRAVLSSTELVSYLYGLSGTKPSVTEAIYWAIVRTLDDADDCETIRGMKEWQGKSKYSEETCPSAAVHHRFHMT
jgi:hypothetical protein